MTDRWSDIQTGRETDGETDRWRQTKRQQTKRQQTNNKSTRKRVNRNRHDRKRKREKNTAGFVAIDQ